MDESPYCLVAASVIVPEPVMPIVPLCAWIRSPLPFTQYGDGLLLSVIVVPDVE